MKLIKVDALHPNKMKIKQAADAIKAGGLVAFPTETVYGLGADALNTAAVTRVFEIKQRPFNQALIIAPSSIADIAKLVKKIPATAKKLIDKFFPGPLTLVLIKSEMIPDIVTADKEKIAFRIPDHPVALALLKAVKRPITATSANITGHPSPTNAQQAIKDFKMKRLKDYKIDCGTSNLISYNQFLILDAGPTKFGLESTILDLTDKPKILRAGAIRKEAIEAVIGPVCLKEI
jgi:L-threonylcarbamoyladenylate synthase